MSAPNTNFIALAAGGYHSLGLKADGTIIAWGWNIFGQINVPAPNTNFIAVSGGREHSLGLKSDGTIVAWGWDAYGQASVPAPNMNFIAVAAGGWHSLGLKADGTIVGWGYNSDGQTSVPVPNTNFIAVAAGGLHSLGLKVDGTIVAWGRNADGQTTVPEPNTNFIAVVAGQFHSLGLKSDGTIVAWGLNDEGQSTVPPPNADFGVSLNSGVAPDSGSAAGGYPVVIIGTDLGDGSDIFNVTLCGAPVSSIDSQSATQIVVTAGMGAAGLGDVRVFSTSHGETVKSNVFTYVIADQTITFPAIAPQHVSDSVSLAATASSGLPVTFAIIDGPGILTGSNLTFSAAGTVVVVGSQAGNVSWDTAVPVTNRVSVYALSNSSGPYAGGNSVTVTNGHFGSITNVLVGRSGTGFQPAMLTASGDAWFTIVMPAIGATGLVDIVIQTSDNGEITLAEAYTYNPAGWIWGNGLVEGRTYLSAGNEHSLGLKADGTVVGWGWNYYGQTTVPAPNSDFLAVAAGGTHSLGLKADGTVVGWGRSDDGRTAVPAPNSNFVAVAAGKYHSLGLKADGTVVGWGWNYYGQTDAPTANSNFVAVAAGENHSLGLKADGTVVAWGRNNNGQATVPTANSNFVAVAAGKNHSLGLKADGTVVAWGHNGNGQTDVPAPNSNFVAVAAGSDHSLGLKADGTVAAWGYNSNGQATVPAPNSHFVAVAAGGYHSLGLKADGTVVAWGGNDYGQATVPAPNANFGLFAYGVLPQRGLSSGGFPVVISGRDLGDGSDITNVTLCGTSVSSIDSQSATQILVTAAAGAVGLGDVRVFSTSHGETVKSNGFTYEGGMITNVVPAAANVGGGIEVLIQGLLLGDGSDITNVTLAGVAATIVTQDVSEVTVMAEPATAAATGDVTVASAMGGFMVLSNAFEYLWLDAPVQYDPIDITPSNLVARWQPVPVAITHVMDVALDTNFAVVHPGYEKLDVAMVEQYPVQGLSDGTWYAIRLFAWNTNGYSGPSRTVWVPATTNTPYETHPPQPGPVSQGAIIRQPLSNMFSGAEMVYTAESSDSNVVWTAISPGGELELDPRNPGQALITIRATDPATGYTTSYSFTVDVVGEPTILSQDFLPRERWNPRFTQLVQVRNDSGLDAIGVRVLFTNLMPGITVENQTGLSADGRPMIEMQTAFTNGTTLDLNIVYLCIGAYRVDIYPPTVELQYILPGWVPPLPGAGVAIDEGVALPDGRLLLQFESVAGRLYAIEYCPDFPAGEWLAVPMRLRATANRTQWIDAGPPATRPFVLGQIRAYRVKEVAE